MSSPEQPAAVAAGEARRTWLPWLLLLPAFPLAWPGPGSPLTDDPYPHLAGAGWIAVLSVPVALYLSFVPGRDAGRVRGLSLLGILFLFVAAWLFVGRPVDDYEARRAFALVAAWPTLFLGGALLDATGRRLFNRGLVVLSILWSAGALLRADALTGVLGNTGTLSQAALPGAAVAAWYVTTRRGIFWLLGLIAVALFLTHAALAPVYAGAVALLVVLVASSFLSPWSRGNAQVRRWLGILAALTVFVVIALRGAHARLGPEPLATEEVAAAELGGVGVRLAVWKRIPGIVAAHPFLGIGPGQFQREFPPHRDPAEAVSSRGGPCSVALTEVDHAHNDWLQALAELGLFGGTLQVVFLLFAARAALRALRGRDFSTIAMGAAGLALVAAACFHSPLAFNPAASALAFVVFGAVLARERENVGLLASTGLARVAACAALVGAFVAFPLLGHGRALVRWIRASQAGDVQAALETGRALVAAHPGSAAARLLALQFDRSDETLAAAQRIRPYSVEVLAARGMHALRSGRPAQAHAHWEQALELSPDAPTLLRNLARLELTGDETESGLARLARLAANGCRDPAWEHALGVDLVLSGRCELGARLLFEQELVELVPEELHARGDDAARVLAHLLWARGQIEAGDHDTAVRSYRQALAPTRQAVPGGAAPLRAELAAALVLAGREEEAREALDGLSVLDAIEAATEGWAREALSPLD